MGKVQIISNEGFWQVDNGKVKTKTFKSDYPGTIVNISVRTDDQHSYMLNSEIPDDIF